METRRKHIFTGLLFLDSIARKYDYFFHGIPTPLKFPYNYLDNREGPLLTMDAIMLPSGYMAVGATEYIYIYDIKKQKLIATLVGHTDLVIKIKYLSNGDIVSESEDKTIRLWNALTFECYDILDHKESIKDFWIVPDDTIISTSFNDNLIIWKLRSDFTVLSRNMPVDSIAIIDNDTIITGSYESNRIHIWNLKSQTREKTLRHGSGELLIFNNYIIVGQEDGFITLYDLKTQKYIQTLVYNGVYNEYSTVVCFCIISNDIIATGSTDGTVRIWNLQTKEHVHSFTIDLSISRESNWIKSIIKLPDGNIVIGSDDSNLYIYNPYIGKLISSINRGEGSVKLLLLPDSRFISIISFEQIEIWE